MRQSKPAHAPSRITVAEPPGGTRVEDPTWEVLQLITDALQTLAVDVDRLVLNSVSGSQGRAEVPQEMLEAIAQRARASCEISGHAWRSVARGLREREKAKAMRVVERFL